MSVRRLYLDSGVVIAASRYPLGAQVPVWSILSDNRAVWLASVLSRLETIPQATFNKRLVELEFYDWFYSKCKMVEHVDARLVEDAMKFAARFGIPALDALHVASALRLGATELITTEKPTKPIHRVDGLGLKIVFVRHDS